MKISQDFIAAAVGVLVIGGYFWHRLHDMNRIDDPANMTTADRDIRERVMQWRESHGKPLLPPAWDTNNTPGPDGASVLLRTHQLTATNTPAPAPPTPAFDSHPHDLGIRQRAGDFTDAEKVEMTNLFVTKLKPAVEKWASVYGDHVPFNLADLTMDKFTERIGRDSKIYHSYTFVMGDITLGIAQRNDDIQVQYLASKHGLSAMQTLPTDGAAPDTSMPVTPQQVLALAQADSGRQIPPNLVQLIPSAESGSLAGGAIADVGCAVRNAMGIRLSNTSAGFNYVFAKDGTLAFYLRN